MSPDPLTHDMMNLALEQGLSKWQKEKGIKSKCNPNDPDPVTHDMMNLELEQGLSIRQKEKDRKSKSNAQYMTSTLETHDSQSAMEHYDNTNCLSQSSYLQPVLPPTSNLQPPNEIDIMIDPHHVINSNHSPYNSQDLFNFSAYPKPPPFYPEYPTARGNMDFQHYNYPHGHHDSPNLIAAHDSTNAHIQRSTSRQEYPRYPSTSQIIGHDHNEIPKRNPPENHPPTNFSAYNHSNYPSQMAPLYPENEIISKSKILPHDNIVNEPPSVQQYHMKRYQQDPYQSSSLYAMGENNLKTVNVSDIANQNQNKILHKLPGASQINHTQRRISVSVPQVPPPKNYADMISKGASYDQTINSTKPNYLHQSHAGPSHNPSSSQSSRINSGKYNKPLVVNSHCFIMPDKIYDRNTRYKDINFAPNENPDYQKYLPKSIQPHVEKIFDVSADGHCGFRAAAFCLGRGQGDYMAIRKELYAEITQRKKFYNQEGTFSNIELALSRINARSDMPCAREHHMSMPSMGEAMANAFKTPVFYFSNQATSQTCFPYFSPPNSNPPIFIGYIEIEKFMHFVALKLKDPKNFPAPRYLKNWERGATEAARGWAQRYATCFNWEGVSYTSRG
jgi:hypothetical protein